METQAEALARLRQSLDQVSRARGEAFAAPARAQAHLALKAWQAGRLERTYQDLLGTARFHDAARFFLDDLYGARDYSRRDADLARILPKMAALLPLAALSTIADAVELDALSEQLDSALLAHLDAKVLASLSEADYASAYRACDNLADRAHQIALMRRTGDALDRLTRKPLLDRTLRLMRGPAHMAGLGELQGFLERGFGAFKRMGSAQQFLDAVEGRETLLMERLFEGHANPFAGLGGQALF